MHVLIIPSWYPSDTNDINGSFFREQALALKKQGCSVGVLAVQFRSLRNWRSIFTGSSSLLVEDDSGIVTYRKYGVLWFPRMPKLQAWLCKKQTMTLFNHYIKLHGKPDVIHVHSMLYAGWAAMAISQKFQIPYVLTEHSSSYFRGLVKAPQIKIAQQIAINAQRRFAVSRPFANHLLKYITPDNDSWKVLPNIVHSRFFIPPSGKMVESDLFVFTNIALLTPNKGVDVLIRAFVKAHAFQPNLKLMIGGDGKARDDLMALANELNVDDSVEFLGMLSRKQVTEQLALSDAFVLSSFYETFGVVVAEALAMGKPIVATRCGGPEDIVREKDGILVPVNDEDALAGAMVKLYNNRDTYDRKEIQNACRARYSDQVIAENLVQVYKEVVQDHGK